jgi:histidine triad (HIT) family protein
MADNEPNCVFCEIGAGRAPAYRVYEDALSYAILDINPYTQGHCLVIPRRHVPWWHEMTEEETNSLFNAARVVANRMMEVYKPDFVLTFTRGRRIPHTHIFLIPTFSGDLLDRFFNALEKVQESSHELARLRETSSMEEAAQMLRQD